MTPIGATRIHPGDLPSVYAKLLENLQ
jgi:hypothetical protein